MVLQQVDASIFLDYWKPTPGKTHTLDIIGNQVVITDFGGKSKMKDVLEIEISEVDNNAFTEPVTFSSNAISFCKDIIPILNFWEAAGAKKVKVELAYSVDKIYTITDKTEELADRKAINRVLKQQKKRKKKK